MNVKRRWSEKIDQERPACPLLPVRHEAPRPIPVPPFRSFETIGQLREDPRVANQFLQKPSLPPFVRPLSIVRVCILTRRRMTDQLRVETAS